MRTVNVGKVAPIAEEAALPLTRDALIGEAAAREGRSGASPRERVVALGRAEFEAEPMIENLDRFLDAIEAEAQLTRMGRCMTRRFVLRLLEVRFQLMDYFTQDPGVLDEQIRAPLFVAGVLKSPVHLHSLPTLFELYPDARVAITHRDPLTLLASLTDLIANLRWAHSDAVDVEAIARSHLRRYRKSFDRLVDWTDSAAIPMQKLHHSRFGDFQKDPLEVLTLLYACFGMEWTTQAEAAMRAALEENPVGRLGAHVYTRDGLGAGIEELRSDFARYQQRFGVPSDD